jgi:site-specific DNA recombinase
MLLGYGYLRVSGDEQADRGLPIAGQREAIQTHAAAHGLQILRWFTDEARPGSTDNRAAFQEMMRLAHEDPPPVGAIVLWSWSRFARDSNDAHFWKASLRRHGVAVLSVAEPIPDNLPAGFDYVLEAAIHWSDARRLEEISHDARRGQQTLARAGYVPSGCRPPRGFRVELIEGAFSGKRRMLRRWVPDPDTWPLAERAWRLRLGGASYQRILRECPGLYRSEGCLATFFRNTAYKGIVTFGGTVIEVEPMVTPEEWERVNALRRQREGGAYPRRQGGTYLLSGLLRCGRCGRLLVGHRTSTGTRNDGYGRAGWAGYRCPGRRGGRCDQPQITAAAIEGALIGQLLETILTPEHLAAQLGALRASLDAERPALEAQERALEEAIGTLDRAIEQLLTSLEGSSSQALVRRLEARETEREERARDLALVRAKLEGPGEEPGDVATIRADLEAALTAGPPQARELLKRLIVEIVVDGQQATVRYHAPF